MNIFSTTSGSIWTLLYIIQCKSALTASRYNYCYSTENKKQQENYYNFETPHYQYLPEIPDMPDNCKPARIWLAIRHGTRYPDKAFSLDVDSFLPYLQKLITRNEYLCNEDYELLKNWTPSKDKNRIQCSLSKPQGWIDLKNLARSFMKMYPELFESPYTPETYTFAHSSALRTIESCEAFVETLFRSKSEMLKSKKNWTKDNLMLMPWQKCPLFREQLFTIQTPLSQYTKFMDSNYYDQVLRQVSQRLGYKQKLLSVAIQTMWNECKFREEYYLQKLSPWCAAFDLSGAKILEYQGDLDFYYSLSYGNEHLNAKLPCMVIKDMITHMTMDDKSSTNKVTAYFTHAELLTLMITAFGAFKDAEPLRADNYAKMKNRKFCSSKLTPTASNIAAVQYKCSASNKFDPDTIKIAMLLNQKPLVMPWCSGGSICTIDELWSKFNNSTMQNCPYGICGENFPLHSANSAMDQDC